MLTKPSALGLLPCRLLIGIGCWHQDTKAVGVSLLAKAHQFAVIQLGRKED